MKKYLSQEVDEIIINKANNGELSKHHKCHHKELIKVYHLGTFNTYTCLGCGLKSLNRKKFNIFDV